MKTIKTRLKNNVEIVKNRYMKSKPTVLVTVIVFLVLLLDQMTKIWVKTNMHYGEEFSIMGLSWAKIHFVENEGMAYGKVIGGRYGKLILSLFRVGACIGLIYYIRLLLKEKINTGLLISFALILAGALGNILDSAFYGLIFSNSPMHGGSIATAFPKGGGYAPFLYGKVVDMLHFPMFSGHLPDWIPFVDKNREYLFFSPVFNIADAAIDVDVQHFAANFRDHHILQIFVGTYTNHIFRSLPQNHIGGT